MSGAAAVCLQSKEQGFKLEPAHAHAEEDDETWEEAMDDMEDPWMREPAGRPHQPSILTTCFKVISQRDSST